MVSALDLTHQVVHVQALAEIIVVHSWAKHITLTLLLLAKEYKWVLMNC